PLAGAPPVSGPPPGSFRSHVRTPGESVRIIPLWLSCSSKPSFLPGREARNKIHGLWFTGGAGSEHRKGPIQSSELTSWRCKREYPLLVCQAAFKVPDVFLSAVYYP